MIFLGHGGTSNTTRKEQKISLLFKSHQFESASAQVTGDTAFTMSSLPQQQDNEAAATGLTQLVASAPMPTSQVPQQVWVA
jgi:hypothetical protein